MRHRAPPSPWILLLCAITVLVPVRAARAGPEVSTAPVCSVVDRDDEFDVRILVNAEAETISTFQVVIRFDPDVIEWLGADEGSLYVNSGYTTWFVSEEESTGVWEVWDVVFPGGSFVVAPGELTTIRFRALADGYSDLEFLTAEVCDIERYPLENLAARDGAVCVGDVSTGVGSGRPPPERIRLVGPVPNPAREGTRLFFSPAPAGGVGPFRYAVFDARGRAVASGTGAGRSFSWDGRNGRGERAAPGVYFIRLLAAGESFTRRMVLIR